MLNLSAKYFPEVFPVLTTKDLTLREVKLSDTAQVVAGLGSKDISQYLGFTPFPFEAKHFEEFFAKNIKENFKNKSAIHFAISETINQDLLIGEVGLELNKFNENGMIGYWLNKMYWNKGYMTQAVKAIIQYAFGTLHLHKIHASHLEHNIASGKVMIKVGMKYEGTILHEIKRFDKYYDTLHYGIFNKDEAK